jgi:hypothetical protein
MVQALTKLLTCAEFIFQYGNNPRYELAEGKVIDMERTGLHEAVGGKLASKLGRELLTGNREEVLGNFTFRYLCRFFSVHLVSCGSC